MSAWMDGPGNYGATLYGRRVRSCHLMADSTAELLQLAQDLGLKADWIQHRGTPKEHFDLLGVRMMDKARRLGVRIVSGRELVQRLRWRRAHGYIGESIPAYQCPEEAG
ncbi:MAG: DUF4031 domain-containing protein [Myxococcota bacterium]